MRTVTATLTTPTPPLAAICPATAIDNRDLNLAPLAVPMLSPKITITLVTPF